MVHSRRNLSIRAWFCEAYRALRLATARGWTGLEAGCARDRLEYMHLWKANAAFLWSRAVPVL